MPPTPILQQEIRDALHELLLASYDLPTIEVDDVKANDYCDASFDELLDAELDDFIHRCNADLYN